LSAGASGTQVMDVTNEVIKVLEQVLSLGGRSSTFTRSTHLLGAIPELDSMAVATLITTLEERFGFMIDDDFDGSTFATVGSLADFVSERLPR
jgi:acyl carrier protein